jgi:hypothetical protein
MNKKIFVICGTRTEYMEFVTKKSKELTEMDPNVFFNFHDFVYVSGPEIIKGYRNPQGYFCGTWRERKDILDIIQIILTSSDEDTLIRNNKTIREFFIQKAIQ